MEEYGSRQLSIAVGTIVRFAYEMKPGDFVVAPRSNSTGFAIGVVTGETVEREQVMIETASGKLREYNGFFKARRVAWLTRQSRYSEPRLYGVFNSHHAVSSLDEYGDLINPMIYDFYKRDGKYYVQIHVDSDEVKATELISTVAAMLEETGEVATANGADGAVAEMDVEMTIHSPGAIVFIAVSFGIAMVLAAVAVSFAGGTIRLRRHDSEVEAQTDGLMDAIRKNREQKARLDHAESGSLRLRGPSGPENELVNGDEEE